MFTFFMHNFHALKYFDKSQCQHVNNSKLTSQTAVFVTKYLDAVPNLVSIDVTVAFDRK